MLKSVSEEVTEEIFHGVAAPVIAVSVTVTVLVIVRILAGSLLATLTILRSLICAFFGSGCSFIFVLGGGLGFGFNRDIDFHLFALTVDVETKDGTGLGIGDHLDKVFRAGDDGIIYLGDDIMGLDACTGCRSIFGNFVNNCAGFDAGDVGSFFRHGGNRDTDIRLQDVAVFNDAGDNASDAVDRNCKADVVNGSLAGIAGRRVLCVGDADDFAIFIEESTAGVAGVDGTVGLDETHGGAGAHSDAAAECADNAACKGEGQLAERVADGENRIADAKGIGIAQSDRLKTFGLNFKNRDIVALIIADDFGIVGFVVIGGNGDLLGICYDVVVGENVTVRGDDETGAGSLESVTVAVTAGGLTADGDTDGGVDILLINFGRSERLPVFCESSAIAAGC